MNDYVCRTTLGPVSQNGMRPGYDCRCSGCMASLKLQLDPQVLREIARQQRTG